MSLIDKVQKRKLSSATIEIDGVLYRIHERSLRDKGRVMQKISKRKQRENGYAEACWLESCVVDAEDGSAMTVDDWLPQGTLLTGPLFSVVAKLNNLLDENVDFEYDPKD